MTLPFTIAGVRHVEVPLRRPLATSRGSIDAIDAWLLRLVSADGRVGVGEATLGPWADAAQLADLARLMRGAVGRAIGGLEPSGMGPAAYALTAALRGALVDVGAVLASRPRRASVPVNALIDAGPPDDTVRAAEAAIGAGFRTLKLKLGAETNDALVRRLAAVRWAAGPGVRLRLDANGAWDENSAALALRALAPIDLELVEQPVAATPDAPAVMARLRRSTGARLAADESVTSRLAAEALMDAEAVDALVLKVARLHGPAHALEIAQAARDRGVGVIVSTLLETGVGLRVGLVTAAMLPEVTASGPMDELAHGLATGSLLGEDVVRDAVPIAAGRAACPPGPGLALDIDRAALERMTVELVGAWP